MRKISEILNEKPRTFSFEFFPPKTLEGREKIYDTARKFAELGADFFSVTYGAGGSTRTDTLEIVLEMQRRTGLPVMHHYTCIRHTHAIIRSALGQFRLLGVRNILAMRGDPPLDQPDYRPAEDEPRYGAELVRIIREHGDWFCVCVPGFPEKHVLTPTKELDSQYLRVKQDAGADFVITQLFFENRDYYDYVDRVRRAGVTMRLIPGILPITDYDKLVKFCRTCGASVAPSIVRTFEPLRHDPEATYRTGIEVVSRQCQDLLDHGSPGLHFFCLNKYEPAGTIFRSLRIKA